MPKLKSALRSCVHARCVVDPSHVSKAHDMTSCVSEMDYTSAIELIWIDPYFFCKQLQ